MTIPEIRRKLSKVLTIVSVSISIWMLFEIGWLCMSGFAHHWLFIHWKWGWAHTSHQTYLRMFIDSWLVAVVAWLVNLMGSGDERRRGFVIGAGNMLGFPAMLCLTVMMSDWIHGL